MPTGFSGGGINAHLREEIRRIDREMRRREPKLPKVFGAAFILVGLAAAVWMGLAADSWSRDYEISEYSDAPMFGWLVAPPFAVVGMGMALYSRQERAVAGVAVLGVLGVLLAIGFAIWWTWLAALITAVAAIALCLPPVLYAYHHSSAFDRW